MEHVVAYRIKGIDDITPLQLKVTTLQKRARDEFGRFKKTVDSTNIPTRKLLSNLNQVGKEGARVPGVLMSGFGRLNRFMSGPLLATMSGVFAISKVTQFTRGVVDTLAKFERFDAVLTNTLGSNSAAQRVMSDIVDLAATTPFEVDSLTDAWVRLANQGFRPSMKELTSLGDLASSTGKDISMLSEAIIDAQVGENERLKEFGVRAEKNGNKVIFTFKGIRTEVSRNASAIQQYLISLGKLPGVQGAMNAISKTTGGLLSNLSDKYTQLKLTIGKGLKPVIEGVILFVGRLIDKFNMHAVWLQKNEELVKNFTANALSKLWAGLEQVGKFIGKMIGFWHENKETIIDFARLMAQIIPPVVTIIMKLSSFVMKLYGVFYKTFFVQIKMITQLWERVSMLFGGMESKNRSWSNEVNRNDPFAWANEAKDHTLPELDAAMNHSTANFKRKANIWSEIIWAQLLGPLKAVKDFLFPNLEIPGFSKRGVQPISAPMIGGDRSMAFKKGNYSPFGFDQWTGHNGVGVRAPDYSNLPFHLRPGYVDTSGPENADIYGSDGGNDTYGGKSKKISDRATDVSGVKGGEIKHIVINIGKLVESFTVMAQNLPDSALRVRKEMAAALLSAVNDANYSN